MGFKTKKEAETHRKSIVAAANVINSDRIGKPTIVEKVDKYYSYTLEDKGWVKGKKWSYDFAITVVCENDELMWLGSDVKPA